MIKEVSTFHSGRYVFSAEISSDLSVINESMNVFYRMPVFPETVRHLRENSLEKAIYGEAKLEESSVTFDQVCQIIKHDRSNFSQDTKAVETINLFMAFRLIEEQKDRELSPELLSEIHKEMVTGLPNIKDVPGQYRKGGAKADAQWVDFDYIPPASTLDINFLIKNLLEWMDTLTDVNPIIKAFLLHLHIKKIQPYCNANGHTARLAEAWYLMKHGVRILPYLLSGIYSSDKKKYYSAVSEFYRTSDPAPFIKYISEGLKETVEQVRDSNFKLMAETVSEGFLSRLLEEKVLIKRQYEFLKKIRDTNAVFSYDDLQLKKPYTDFYGSVSRTTVARDIKKYLELGLITENNGKYSFCGNASALTI